MLYDMHCHLDFAEAGVQAAFEARGAIAAFSATVEPRSYEAALAGPGAQKNVRIGWGLHPWQARRSDFADLLDAFLAGVARHAFIGEVGLDFAAKHASTRERQLDAFERIVRACLEAPFEMRARLPALDCGIVSIHAVHAADELADILGRAGALDACCRSQGAFAAGRALVVHSFNGTSDQLNRLVRAGLFFSVGPRLLATRRGRAYVRTIPSDRLLLETDMPSAQGAPFSFDAWRAALEESLAALAYARGEDEQLVREAIARTSARILGL